jgi:hypothetical protein
VTFEEFRGYIKTKSFVKLVRKLDLNNLANLEKEGIRTFETLAI